LFVGILISAISASDAIAVAKAGGERYGAAIKFAMARRHRQRAGAHALPRIFRWDSGRYITTSRHSPFDFAPAFARLRRGKQGQAQWRLQDCTNALCYLDAIRDSRIATFPNKLVSARDGTGRSTRSGQAPWRVQDWPQRLMLPW